MVRPQWAYAAAREQTLSDESGGRSGAEEVADEARHSQGESPQANAELAERRAVKRTAPEPTAACGKARAPARKPGGAGGDPASALTQPAATALPGSRRQR